MQTYSAILTEKNSHVTLLLFAYAETAADL